VLTTLALQPPPADEIELIWKKRKLGGDPTAPFEVSAK
jgi:hypothetical protein